MRQRLEKAVASTRLPPWPAAATATSRRATVFLARRFGKALRLQHSILAFDGFLPRRSARTPALCQLVCLPSIISQTPSCHCFVLAHHCHTSQNLAAHASRLSLMMLLCTFFADMCYFRDAVYACLSHVWLLCAHFAVQSGSQCSV